MNSPFEQVFSHHIDVDMDNSFQVSFFIDKGCKVDGGILTYQFLEITKLTDGVKYTFVKQPAGFDGRPAFVLNKQAPQISWSDSVHRQLFNAINNLSVPSKFIVNKDYFSGIM